MQRGRPRLAPERRADQDGAQTRENAEEVDARGSRAGGIVEAEGRLGEG